MNKTRKIAASAMVAGAALFLVSANSYATGDGCDRNSGNGNIGNGNSGNGNIGNGNSGNGNIGNGNSGNGNIGNGTNEDPCSTTTTTTGLTVPALPEVTVPTVPEVTVPALPEVTVPTVPGATDSTIPEATAPPVDRLPATGTSSEALAGFGAGMLLLGTGMRKLARNN